MEKKTPLLLDQNNEAYLIEYLGGMTGVIKNKNENIIGMIRINQSEVILAEPNGTEILKTAGKGWFHITYNLVKDSNGKILGKFLENTFLNTSGDVILKVEASKEEKRPGARGESLDRYIKRLEKLESLVLQVASRELRAIEILGGVLGIVIGLGQVALHHFIEFGG